MFTWYCTECCLFIIQDNTAEFQVIPKLEGRKSLSDQLGYQGLSFSENNILSEPQL